MVYRRSEQTQARLDAQRVAILRTATALVAQHGYGGFSMAAVAGACEVSTGTLYNHFANKSELAAAIFRDVVGREVDAVAVATSTGTAIERAVSAVETFAGRAMKNPTLAYALLAEPVDPEVDAERLRFRREFAAMFQTAIADGIAEGTVPPQDSQLTAAALIGAIAEVLTGPLSSEPHPELVIPGLVAFSLRALGVSDADA